MLRKRFKLFGAQSPEPAQTLFDAYWQLERSDEAFAVLEEARQMLPEDGPLSLFAANAYYQIGKYKPAQSHLSKSRGLVAEDEWLIVAARGESVRGNRAAALSLWRKVAENAPFNIEAHSQCARLIAEADGDLAAQAYLRQASSQRPQYLPLQKLYIEWLRDDTQAQEAALRAVLRQDQADLWAHHELAALLGRHHRWPEAFAVNDTLQQLAPYAPEVYLLRGQLLLATQKREEAQSNFRYALQLAVSVERGVSLYLAACRNLEERRQALHFVRDQILQQHNIGESVIAFAELARGVFNPDELHGHLREIWQRRPDLWETWAALIGHLNDAQHQDAITLAQRAVERFPQIPGVWRLQAGVWRSSGKLSEEIAALRQGLSINPLWAPMLQELAYAYRKDGQEAAARQLLRQAVFQSPRDPLLHGCLAEALWPAGERETAISELRHAILLAPDYEWAWRMLYEWSEETGRPHLASDLARELTVKNPGEVNSWLNLSKTLKGREAFPERLKAADEALRLNPHSIAARVWKARLLANNQRLDEALQVCREPLWGAFIPADLRHLAALILSEQGDTQKALQEMEKLSREESDYAPVWETLLDWRTRQENWPEVLRAAQALVNLQPQNPDVWIDLGRARRFANDSGGAVTAFQQAFTLDPAHPAAGEHYFTLQLEEGDLNGARQTLSRRLPFIQTAARLFGELRLALQYRDETKALELLRQLCVTPEAASDHYQGALEALKKAGALPKALTVFEQSLQTPDVNPVVGPIWVSQCAGANELNTVEKVFSQSGVAPATWPQTAHAFLTETANGGLNDVVERFIQAHGPRLAADNLSWGGVGYALNQIGAYEKNRQYMRDWRQREGLQAWMLWNLALSLRSLNEIAEARAVSFRACALEDPDAADHYVLLAFDDALTGNSKEARQHFAQTPPTDSAWQQAVGRFTRLLLETDNAASVSEGLRELLDFGSQHQSLWGASLLARMYQQTIEHLVARTEGKLARLKAKWQVSQARRAAQKSG
jgi:tetratricopeptide (TPR) repeat protein